MILVVSELKSKIYACIIKSYLHVNLWKRRVNDPRNNNAGTIIVHSMPNDKNNNINNDDNNKTMCKCTGL